MGIGTYSQKTFQSEPMKIRKNILALQILVTHFFTHSKKIGRAYFEIDKENEKKMFENRREEKFYNKRLMTFLKRIS